MTLAFVILWAWLWFALTCVTWHASVRLERRGRLRRALRKAVNQLAR